MRQIPFCGRAEETAVVGAHLEEALAGRGRAVVVEGDAGIGKTALLDHAVRHARDLGFRVWSGAADEFESRRPFAAIAACLGLRDRRSRDAGAEDPRAEIRRLLTEDDPARSPGGFADGTEAYFRVREAFLSFADVSAADGPLAFVIDDLHWADPASLLVLYALVRAAANQQLLLLGSARRFPRNPELDRLLGPAVTIGVDPLPEEEWSRFAEHVLGKPPGKILLDELAVAGGNPLFMSELLGAIEQESLLVGRDDGTIDVESVTFPPSLSVTILRRLAFLPAATIEVLGLASVVGARFRVADLQMLLDRKATDLASALRPAVKVGILSDTGEGLVFRHELIRQALYDDLTPSLTAAAHKDFAAALSAAGASPGRIAEHMIRCASPGDVGAADWLVRAAEESRERSPSVAVDLLERAIAIGGDGFRARAIPAMGLALFGAARLTESEAVVREAIAARPAPAVEGELRNCLVYNMLLQGRVSDMIAECRAAIATGTLGDADEARFVAWEALGALLVADRDTARARAADGVAAGERAGDAQALCMTWDVQALVRYMEGHALEALPLAEQAVRAADDDEDGHRTQPLLIFGTILIDVDRLDDSLAALERGRRKAEELGTGSLVPIYHWAAAVPLYFMGRWGDALAELEASSQLADTTLSLSGESRHVARAMIAVARGDLDEAAAAVAAVDAALASMPAMPMFRIEWLAAARADLLRAQGRHEEADAVVEAIWSGLVSVGLGWLTIGLATEMTRRAVESGDPARAGSVLAEVERVVAANPGIAWIEATALRCAALIQGDADAHLAAVERFRASMRSVDLAGALEDAAVALAAEGRADEARAHLEEALGLYESFGAARYAARAEAAVRPFGLRRGRRGRRGRPKTGWESLTQTERTVAGLVAERLTNPEIGERLYISRRTVQTHVSSALGKLGLRSRTELGELARIAAGSG